ncbi:MAG TPA: phosphotransferase [Mycobacteriales bacterium]|jgi:aminoglycoside phosphotransferase (APT) family kinase protein|nr:phosphotransferase [Mycobacteriales bacterium]
MSSPLSGLVGGAEVVPLSGGYSGETFLVTGAAEQAVLRLYARQPSRAAIDQALLERLRGLLPVPRVLEAVTVPDRAGRPPFLLLEALPGDRLDMVLPAADEPLRRRLGEAVAGVLTLLATERMPRAGMFLDAGLDPVPFPAGAGDQAGFLAANRDAPFFADLSTGDYEALRSVARRAAMAAARSSRIALVHADFNPKNLLVDPATGGVTGVLDWEFAYAGAPLGDLGNLLRFEEDPVFAGAVAAAYVDRAPDVPADWLETARALDLYALIDLSARDTKDTDNPVVAGARELLRATARTRSLAAERPDLFG